jgi:RimJ/RimL family protein N-acetyltransferase
MDCADRLTARRLESERLTLEPLRPEHADELAPVLDDVSLHRFIGGRPDTAEELRARFERQAVGRSPDGRALWLSWTVRVRPGGQAVGTVQATVTAGERQPAAVLAWVIGASHQGQGFAREAAVLVVSWLRAAGVSRVRARIHPDHGASMAVARSVGLLPTDVREGGEVLWEREAAVGPARAGISRQRPPLDDAPVRRSSGGSRNAR